MERKHSGEPKLGKEFFELTAGLGGAYLLVTGLAETCVAFSVAGQESMRATAIFKVLTGISTLVVDYREMKNTSI